MANIVYQELPKQLNLEIRCIHLIANMSNEC